MDFEKLYGTRVSHIEEKFFYCEYGENIKYALTETECISSAKEIIPFLMEY